MQLFTVTMSWTLMPLGWSRRRLPADSWWLSILDLQPLQRDETQRWDEVYYKVNRIKSYMFLIFVATSSKIKMVIFGPCPLAPTISDTISGQGQRPGWMGGWQLCSVVWWRWMVVRQLSISPFFSFLFSLLSSFVRYANCGNVRPTGLHLRTRRRRTKRSHQSKNIVYYSGGSRGNTYNSWAEAKFILVPKK